ncbi:glycosyltransferase family 4 protein [Bacillus thuringiensis]|uniref:glycosyltransferase family 4 protein n=1 Tax=Bacillus thuringiensis TaxID=1428 RepID=UPI000BF31BAF|nr:glycosyltransferase family 1 protein [Bacillus thuringiensis]PFH74659.1 mannosyltransferase [Bacillus thuringiensis]
MQVYINGRFLTQRVTGVQRFAIETIKQLDLYEDYNFILLVPKECTINYEFKNIRVEKIGTLNGHLWEQLELARYVKGHPLINLCNTAPLFKKNQIVVIHDAAVYTSPQGFSFLFRNWYKTMFYFISKRTKEILTISDFSTKELMQYLKLKKQKLGFISEGKEHFESIIENTEVLQKFSLKKNNYVLAVSSLNPNKNFKALIQAAGQLLNESFDIVIAGGADPKVFGDVNIEGANIKYLGYITDEDLKGLYRNAGCFVFPSIYEGFGLPPLEAMSVGCPVLVSNMGPMPEVSQDAAIYFNPYDTDELASKIKLVMSNDNLQTELSEKGLKQAQKFSWTTSAKQLIETIKNLD